MRGKPGRGLGSPGPGTQQSASDAHRVGVAERLRALADERGYDAVDVARKLGCGIARAQSLLQGSPLDEREVDAAVRLVDG